MTAQSLTDDLLKNVGGVDKNNLNTLLELSSKHDEQTQTFNQSYYYDIESLIEIFKSSDEKFTTISINIESINAKFNQFLSFLHFFDENACNIDAIFIQESWLSDQQCTSNILANYFIPGYHLVPLESKSRRKGDL